MQEYYCYCKGDFNSSIFEVVKILVVIANYSPVQNPNVIRWSAIVKHWKSMGHEIDILTSKHSQCAEESNIDGINIFRAGHASLKDFYYNSLNKKQRRNEPLKNNDVSEKGWVEKIIDKTWRKNYWPDGAMLMIKPGKKLISRLYKKNNYDKCFTVGLPFSCHLIGQFLKEHYPEIHWHMDIEDPFSYSKELFVNNFNKYDQKNIKAEKRAIELADSISVTNQAAKDIYIDKFDNHQKINIIPPLFIRNNTITQNKRNDKVIFGYFGSFYENIRSPEPFLKILREIKKLTPQWLEDKLFLFYGQQNPWSQGLFNQYSDLNKNVVLKGLIPSDEVISTMQQTDILVNFGNKTSYHLPSKSVEYLWLRKPIINMVWHEQDSFANFMNGEQGVLNIDFEEATIEESIVNIKEYVLNRNTIVWNKEKIEKRLESHSISSISNQYLSA